MPTEDEKRDFDCTGCGQLIYVGLSDNKAHNTDTGKFHACPSALEALISVAEEIAHDPNVDLVDSERRIRLYAALMKTGRL